MDEWLSQRSAKPCTAVRIRLRPQKLGHSNVFQFFFVLTKHEKSRPTVSDSFILCGVTEIRTRESLLTITRFPGVPLQPLEHHSIACAFAFANLALLPLSRKL